MKTFWHRWLGLLLCGLFLLIGAAGMWGFTLYQADAGLTEPVTTRLYLTVQLFVLESGAVSGTLPWQLEFARMAAPAVAAYALVATLAAVLHEQLETWRVRRMRGHVVVVGLGNQGLLISRALLSQGRDVVGVDIDAMNPAAAALRADRGLVVVGDARMWETLHRARVEHATNLVVLSGDDGVTTEVLAATRQLATSTRSSAPVRCVGLLSDAPLWTLLAMHQLQEVSPSGVHVDFVNALGAGAQSLARLHPPIADPREQGSVRAVLTGWSSAAPHVVLALVRNWGCTGEHAAPLPLTVIGAEPHALDDLQRRHPEVARWAALSQAADVREAIPPDTDAVVYVCEPDDSSATARTLELHRVLTGSSRVIVVQERVTAVGELLHGRIGDASGPAVVTFGLLDETCRPEVLMSGTTELLAQAIHRTYLEHRSSDGTADGDDPALRPWLEMPEALRESNRAQAAHIPVKLRAVGRVLGPLANWDEAQSALSPAEIESMSELEHERWVTERTEAGWRPGPRNTGDRTTPYLVSWPELPEEIREYDRLFIRGLPRLLASIGLQVLPKGRLTAPPRTSS